MDLLLISSIENLILLLLHVFHINRPSTINRLCWRYRFILWFLLLCINLLKLLKLLLCLNDLLILNSLLNSTSLSLCNILQLFIFPYSWLSPLLIFLSVSWCCGWKIILINIWILIIMRGNRWIFVLWILFANIITVPHILPIICWDWWISSWVIISSIRSTSLSFFRSFYWYLSAIFINFHVSFALFLRWTKFSSKKLIWSCIWLLKSLLSLWLSPFVVLMYSETFLSSWCSTFWILDTLERSTLSTVFSIC